MKRYVTSKPRVDYVQCVSGRVSLTHHTGGIPILWRRFEIVDKVIPLPVRVRRALERFEDAA
ncbi:MAG: hypothetical protein AAFQ52_02495 [Chloroflexota bacterium]